MLALERLTEGAWIAAGSPGALHTYDWGAGKRTLMTRSLMGTDHDRHVAGEGLWFHDPVARHYRVLGFEPWGRVEGAMTRNKELWTQSYELHLEGETLAMRDLWQWEGPKGGQYVSHYVVDGEEQRQATRFSSVARPEVLPEPVAAATLPAGPLEPLAFLAGGTWEMQTTWPDGSPFHIQDEHRWGAHKLCLWKRTYRIDADGTRTPTVDGVYYADSEDPRVLRFVMVADEGAVYEGTVSREEGDLTFVYQSKQAQRTLDLREVHRFRGGSMQGTLWLVTEDGEQELYADVPYHRRPRKDGQ